MLAPQQVIDQYFLENRHMLLEVAAFLDRYDAAVGRTDRPAVNAAKLDVILAALGQLSRKEAPSTV